MRHTDSGRDVNAAGCTRRLRRHDHTLARQAEAQAHTHTHWQCAATKHHLISLMHDKSGANHGQVRPAIRTAMGSMLSGRQTERTFGRASRAGITENWS